MSLGDRTEDLLQRLTPGAERPEARRLLAEECSRGVPGWELAGLERLHAAVPKLRDGSHPRLVDAVVPARTDVRDALVSAGFGDDESAREGWTLERRST